MNDSLSIKALSGAALTGTQFPGSAIALPRIVSTSRNEAVRQSLVKGDLSPLVVRVAHQSAGASTPQRSLYAHEQSYGRLDTASILTATHKVKIKITAEIDPGITQAEYVTAVEEAFGALAEGNFAVAKQLYNREL